MRGMLLAPSIRFLRQSNAACQMFPDANKRIFRTNDIMSEVIHVLLAILEADTSIAICKDSQGHSCRNLGTIRRRRIQHLSEARASL